MRSVSVPRSALLGGRASAILHDELEAACEIYEDLAAYINSDWALKDWADAISYVLNGDAAFSVMGDWANGEFLTATWNYTTDYGTIPTPGTDNMYGLVVDCFEKPKNIPSL